MTARRQHYPETALPHELYSAGALVETLVNAELAAVGVPPQLFSFLSWIRLLQPVSPGRLSAETGMPPTTIRDYVRRLIERGDVRRKPNPRDGRSYELVVTPRGQRLIDRGAPAVADAWRRVEPRLPRPADEYLPQITELRGALRETLARAAEREVPAA